MTTTTTAGFTGLLRHELDGMRCAVPNCDHENHEAMYVHAACHVKGGTKVRYLATGVLLVHCGVCDNFVAAIAIGAEDVSRLSPKVACDDPNCTEPLENHCLTYGHPGGEKPKKRFPVLRGKPSRINREREPDPMHVVYSGGKLTISCSHGTVLETLTVKERSAQA